MILTVCVWALLFRHCWRLKASLLSWALVILIYAKMFLSIHATLVWFTTKLVSTVVKQLINSTMFSFNLIFFVHGLYFPANGL